MLAYEYKVDGTKRQYAAIDEAIRVVQFIGSVKTLPGKRQARSSHLTI